MASAAKSQNLQIMDTWCQRVWQEQDASAIAALFEESGTAGGLGRDVLAGPSDFRGFHAAMCELMSDTCLKTGEYMEEGNKVCCLATFSGKCRKTGKDVSIDGSMFFEFANGKILHCANHFEFIDLFEQLGLMPEASFATALSGMRVASMFL